MSDHNIEVKTSCSVLQDRLKVLEVVERQLKNSLGDEVEVDGIFLSNAYFNSMIHEVVESGESVWDMI